MSDRILGGNGKWNWPSSRSCPLNKKKFIDNIIIFYVKLQFLFKYLCTNCKDGTSSTVNLNPRQSTEFRRVSSAYSYSKMYQFPRNWNFWEKILLNSYNLCIFQKPFTCDKSKFSIGWGHVLKSLALVRGIRNGEVIPEDNAAKLINPNGIDHI